MTNLTRITAVAVFAAAAWAGASSFTPAAAAPQEGLTQELSAACRTVVSTRWSNGRRVTTQQARLYAELWLRAAGLPVVRLCRFVPLRHPDSLVERPAGHGAHASLLTTVGHLLLSPRPGGERFF